MHVAATQLMSDGGPSFFVPWLASLADRSRCSLDVTTRSLTRAPMHHAPAAAGLFIHAGS
jgi:hypothetical protein